MLRIKLDIDRIPKVKSSDDFLNKNITGMKIIDLSEYSIDSVFKVKVKYEKQEFIFQFIYEIKNGLLSIICNDSFEGCDIIIDFYSKKLKRDLIIGNIFDYEHPLVTNSPE